MRLALIDLDDLELVTKSIQKARVKTPEGKLIAVTFELMMVQYFKALSSQPELIKLISKAWQGGFRSCDCGEIWQKEPETLNQFLNQNNLTNEKTE